MLENDFLSKNNDAAESSIILMIEMFDRSHEKERLIGKSNISFEQFLPSELNYENFILGGSKHIGISGFLLSRSNHQKVRARTANRK